MILSFSSFTDVFRCPTKRVPILNSYCYTLTCGGGLSWSMEKYTDIDLKPEVELLRVIEAVGRDEVESIIVCF